MKFISPICQKALSPIFAFAAILSFVVATPAQASDPACFLDPLYDEITYIAAPGSNDFKYTKTGDFNGDGNADFFIAKRGSPAGQGLVYYAGNGDGTFQDPVIVEPDISFRQVITADVDNDGFDDLVGENFTPVPFDFAVYYGSASGDFSRRSFKPVTYGIFGIDVADINGDELLDIVSYFPDSRIEDRFISVLLNDGARGFSTVLFDTPSALQEFIYTETKSVDLDNDGFTDLLFPELASEGDDGNYVFAYARGLPGGDLEDMISLPISLGSGRKHTFFDTFDVNQDGMSDLVILDTTDDGEDRARLVIFMNEGGLNFSPPVTYDITGSRSVDYATLADVNGDEIPDFVINEDIYRVSFYVMLGNPDGTFRARQAYNTKGIIGRNRARNVGLADFNHDGRLDVVTIGDRLPVGEDVNLHLNRCGISQCVADFDDSETLDTFDFLAFQNDWDAGGTRADIDGNGELEISDFLAFQNEFEDACTIF